jgi:excisionase family DNA binding protein
MTDDLDALADKLADKVEARLRAKRDDRPLLSAKALAVRLDVSERTARQMIADKVLPSVKTGGLTKVEPAAVDAYLERQRGAA